MQQFAICDGAVLQAQYWCEWSMWRGGTGRHFQSALWSGLHRTTSDPLQASWRQVWRRYESGVVTSHDPFQIFSPPKTFLALLKLEISVLYTGCLCEVLAMEPAPQMGKITVKWPVLYFRDPNHNSGMNEATVIKFYTHICHIKLVVLGSQVWKWKGTAYFCILIPNARTTTATCLMTLYPG